MPREFGSLPSEAVEAARQRLDRAAVEAMLERGEKQFEGRDLKDLDLAELNLEGASFCRADVRGLALYRLEGEQTKQTNIRGTNWTDATFADLGPQTVFQYVNAERATFGFSESLAERRKRRAESDAKPTVDDTGSFHNFDGRGGSFSESRWLHADFGGEVDAEGRPVEGWEALFQAADFSGAYFEGVDLKGIDWSRDVILDGITMKDPVSLQGLTLREEQAAVLAEGIQFSDHEADEAWRRLRERVGDARALQEHFGVITKTGT